MEKWLQKLKKHILSLVASRENTSFPLSLFFLNSWPSTTIFSKTHMIVVRSQIIKSIRHLLPIIYVCCYQSCGEGRHDPVPRVQPEGAAALPLALVHGPASQAAAAALHRQPAVDAQGFGGHPQTQRPLRLCAEWSAEEPTHAPTRVHALQRPPPLLRHPPQWEGGTYHLPQVLRVSHCGVI